MIAHCSTVYASPVHNVLKSKSSWYRSYHMISASSGGVFICQK